MILLVVLIMIFVVYLPSLSGQFLNWDDDTHLTQHVPVRFLNGFNLRHVFSSTVLKTYIPLTITSFIFEYHLFGYQPFIYRLDNLLLHLFTTAMVFLIGRQFKLSEWAAGAAALAFGIHPMHVESVAWISQRKDVLCASFYLLAIWSYGRWLERGRRWSYLLAVLCALASILSKPMAVSLPWVLWVVDYYWRRRFSWKMVLDKLPFFFAVIPLALITFMGHERVPIQGGGQAVLIWVWSYAFYLRQFLAPIVLLPIYHLPQPVSLTNPHYVAAVVIFAASWLLLHRKWKDSLLQKGWLFFLAAIFFLLRLRPDAGPNLVADRFMYLPSVGFCLWMGWMAEKSFLASQRQPRRVGQVTLVLMAGLAVCWAGLTARQGLIWKDSLSLWNHVIRYSSSQAVAFNNRGSVLRQQGQWKSALQDFNRAIELKPDYSEAYNNRGLIYQGQEDFPLAIADQTKAVECNPQNERAYNNRGVSYASLGDLESAMLDFNQAIAVNPLYPEAYNNRAITHEKLGQPDLALTDYQRAISLNAVYKDAYRNRGILYLRRGEIEKARADFARAQ